MMGREVPNNTTQHEVKQNNYWQNYQTVSVREEVINTNNRPQMQNIHQEYNKSERNSSSDRQFFAPQTQQMQSCDRKSKAVQVDHVEEQYVTRKNMFSDRNPLYIDEMERPVFMNNYYAGKQPTTNVP